MTRTATKTLTLPQRLRVMASVGTEVRISPDDARAVASMIDDAAKALRISLRLLDQAQKQRTANRIFLLSTITPLVAILIFSLIGALL